MRKLYVIVKVSDRVYMCIYQRRSMVVSCPCCCACRSTELRSEYERFMKHHIRKMEQEAWDAELRLRVREQEGRVFLGVDVVDFRDLGDAEVYAQLELRRVRQM